MRPIVTDQVEWSVGLSVGLSLYRRFPDNHFPGQTFPGQVILRNFHVHNVCKYQLYRPSPVPDMTYNVFSGTLNPTQSIDRPSHTERLLMCACRPAIRIRGLFGKACSPTVGKA